MAIDEEQKINAGVTYDETLKQDAINSALGKDTVNSFSITPGAKTIGSTIEPVEIKSSTSTKDIHLNKQEEDARQLGSNDFENNVIHTSEEDQRFLSNGTVNITKANAEDYAQEEEDSILTGKLYRDMLGNTAYSELKTKCGIAKDESFTDYYNRTHYIPKGYEIDAKLALAEERRMKLYESYAKKEISYSKFLYEAYGKDLLKQDGYDLSSPIFWYNRLKKGDYTNPLDSPTMLQDLINNSDAMFKADSWYRESSSKALSTSLRGLVTGDKLEEEEFEKIFKAQCEALNEYFDNDTKKIMTYYQAGYLNSVFSPFVDVNGDGKYDYYYHTDGKLYAVDNDDSVGTGDAKVTLVYNDDGSVHSAQVHEGLDGWGDSLWDGFSQFFTGVLDIGALAVNGVSAIFGVSFTEQQAKWEAWKKRTIADEDRVVFDSMSEWNAADWGNGIAEGVGYIAGMVLLILATVGIGAIVGGGTAATETGVSAAGEAVSIATKAGAETATVETVKAGITEGIKTINSQLAGKAATAATNAMYRELLKQVGEKLPKDILLQAGKKALTQGARAAATKSAVASTAKIINTAFNTAGKARGGAVASTVAKTIGEKIGGTAATVTANAWFQAGMNAAEIAVRDALQMSASLHAQNRVLSFMADNYRDEDGNAMYHTLSEGEIFGRVAAVVGADLFISTLFRATNDQGFSSRIAVNTSAVSDNLANANQAYVDKLTTYIKNMRTWSTVDSFLDIFENISTASIQAAMSNPYAQDAKSLWKTAVQSTLSPKSLMMNAYALTNNLRTWGIQNNGQAFNTSIYDDRMAALLKAVKDVADVKSAALINNFSAALAKSNKFGTTNIHKILTDVNNQTKAILRKAGSSIDNAMEANEELDKLFTDDIVTEYKQELIIALKVEHKDDAEDVYDKIVDNMKKNNCGFMTAYALYRANTANDDYVKTVYETILDKANEIQAERQQTYVDIIEKNPNIITKLKANKAGKIANYYGQMINDVGKRAVADYVSVFEDNDYIKTFVESRFETLHCFTDKSADNKSAREKELDQLKKFFETNIVKQGSFSDSTFLSQEQDNPLAKLFMNAEANKEAIDKLVAAGIIKVKADGTYDFTGGAPLWFYSIPLDKRNEFISALNSKDYNELRNFFNTVELMSYLYELGTFDTHSVSPLTKISVVVGTPDNPKAKQDVYIVGNTFGAGLAESVQRLQVTEAILYTTFTLKKYSESTSDVLPQEDLQFYMAQLGELQIASATTDTYNNFLERWKNSKNKGADFEKQILLATTMLLKGVGVTSSQGKPLLTRTNIINLYRNKAISLESLKTLSTNQDKDIATKAQFVIDVIDYSISENNKIKSALGILNKIQNDTATDNELPKAKKELMETITYLRKHKELRAYLEASDALPKPIKILIDSNINSPEALENFISELQRVTQFGALRSCVSGGNEDEIALYKEALIKIFLSKDAVMAGSYSININSLIKKSLAASLGIKPKDAAYKTFTYITRGKRYKDFLLNPEKVLQDYMDAYKPKYVGKNYDLTKDKGLIARQKNVDDIKTLLPNLFNADGTLNRDKFIMPIAEQLSGGFAPTSDDAMFKTLKPLLSVALGFRKDETLERTKFTNTSNVYMYDGKKISDIIFDSPNTKKVISYTLRDTSEKIIDDTIKDYTSYIFDNTVPGKPLNCVTLNILEILPANLLEVLTKISTSEELKTKAESWSRDNATDLLKEVKKLTGGYASGITASQYKAYSKMLNYAISTGEYIRRFDLNNEEHMNMLRVILTSFGYNNDIKDIETQIKTIPGLHYKTYTTNNLHSSINYEKAYNAMMSKFAMEQHLSIPEESKKDYYSVAINLFASLDYITDDTTIKLPSADNLPYYIYSPTSDKFEFVSGWTEEELDRAIKGTLEGGRQLQKYFIRNRSLEIDKDNSLEDIRYTNTSKVLSMVDSVIKYLSSLNGNTQLSMYITVPKDKVKEFEAMYSSPDSLYTYTKITKTKYLVTSKVEISKLEDFKKTLSGKDFNLRQIIPIWGTIEVNNVKNITPEEFGNWSNETLFSKLVTARIPGISNSEDVKRELTRTYKANELYTFDSTTYENFIEANDNLSFKQLLKLVSADKYKDDYFMQGLKYYLESSKAISEYAEQNLADNLKGLLSIANKEGYNKIKKLFNETLADKMDSNYDLSEDDIKLVAATLGIDVASAAALVDAIKNSQDSLLVTTLDNTAIGVPSKLLNAFDKCIQESDDGKLEIAIEYLLDCDKATRLELREFLYSLMSTMETEEEQRACLDLIDSLNTKLDTIASMLPSEDDDNTYFENILVEYANLNAPNINIPLYKGFLSNGVGELKNAFQQMIAKAVKGRNIHKAIGSQYKKLSTINLGRLDNAVDSIVQSFADLLNNNVLRGIQNNPGSIMVENLERRDMVGRLFTSVLASAMDITHLMSLNGHHITKEAATELALKLHILTTGMTYQSEYATSMMLEFDDTTGEYKIVPLDLSAGNEDNTLFQYFLARKAYDDEFNEVDYSLASIAKQRKDNDHKHFYLVKGSKNMFVDSLAGESSDTSGMFCLDTGDDRNRMLTFIINKSLENVTTKESQAILDNISNLQKHLADYYDLGKKIPMQDLWAKLYKDFKSIGVDISVLPTIFNSVQGLYVGNATTLNKQVIDDVIQKLEENKDSMDTYSFNVIMDTLKFGVNSATLNQEDKENFVQASNVLRHSYEVGKTNEELSHIQKTLHDGIITPFVEGASGEILDLAKQMISKLSDEDKEYCLKQILLNRLNGSDIYSILNSSINNQTLEQVRSSLATGDDFTTDWKTKDGLYNIFTAAKNKVHAVFDLEWLTKKNDPNYNKGLYQIAFAIRKPDATNNNYYKYDKNTLPKNLEFNILIKDNLYSKTNANGKLTVDDSLVHQNENISENPDMFYFTESADTYFEKVKLASEKGLSEIDFTAGSIAEQLKHNESQLGNDNFVIVVQNQQQAVQVMKAICDAEGVEMLLGFNSFNTDGVSDINFLKENGYEFNGDMLDIRYDVLNKVHSHLTDKLDGEKMDDVRALDILSNKHREAHDALSDVEDEYELFCKILDNPTRTEKVYTNSLDILKEAFGENVFNNLKFNKLDLSNELSKVFTSIDNTKKTFVRGNQSIKTILDDYNDIMFNANARSINTKALNKQLEAYKSIYNYAFDKAFRKAVFNKSSNTKTKALLLKLMTEASGRNLIEIIKSDNFDDNDLQYIANGANHAMRVLAIAEKLYSYDVTKQTLETSIALASKANMFKKFMSLDYASQLNYLAEAKFITTYKTFKEGLEAWNKLTVEQQQAQIINFGNSVPTDVEINSVKYDKFYNSFKTNKYMNYTAMELEEVQSNLNTRIINPLAKAFGLFDESDTTDAYSDINTDSVIKKLSDDTKKYIINDLLSVYGTTEDNLEKIRKIRKERAESARRITKIMSWTDSFSDKMMENFFDKEQGLFTKNLRDCSSLWSMGTTRRSFRNDGEENTLYIGRNLLTSRKAWSALYGKYNVGNEFYVLSWRQPLQQTTPMQVIKVKVVDGYEYSMTESTARNLHNGDFDGDYFYNSLPTENSELFGKSLWEYQNVAGGLFSNLFDTDLDWNRVDNLSFNEAGRFKKIFTSMASRFISILTSQDESLIKQFNEDFITTYVNEYAKDVKNGIVTKEALLNYAKDALDKFGFKVVETTEGSIIRTDNPYFYENETIRNLINSANKRFMNQNITDTKLDAPENGQLAKNYKWQEMTVEPTELYKLFYNNSFSMDDKKLTELTHYLMYNKLSGTKIKAYIDDLYSKKLMTDKEYKAAINFAFVDGSIKKLTAQNLLELSQFLNEAMLRSKVYNETLNTIVPKLLSNLNKEDYKKYSALYDFMSSEGYKDIGNKVKEGSNLSGLMLLQLITNMAGTIYDDRQRKQFITYASSEDPTMLKIYQNAIARNAINSTEFDDTTKIISSEDLVKFNIVGEKILGLGSAVVAVDLSEEESSDTMYVTKGSNLTYNNIHKIEMNSLPKKFRVELLSSLSTGLIDNKTFKKATGSDFEGRIEIIGLVDKFNKVLDIDSITNVDDLIDCTLVIANKDSLYNLSNNNVYKLGIANAKAGKGPVKQFTENVSFGKNKVDLIMNKSLFNLEKIGSNVIGFGERIQVPVYDSNGKKIGVKNYQLYKINNLAVLNSFNLDAQDSAKNHYIDTIGLIQGAHGLGSLVNFGNLYIQQNEDGTYTFNPSAFSELQQTLGYDNLERRYQVRNNAPLLRTLRIITYLSALSPDVQAQEITKLSKGVVNTIDGMYKYLMSNADIGGDYGARIESNLYNDLSKEDVVKVKALISRKDNVIARLAFSKELDDIMIDPYASYFKDDDYKVLNKKQKPTEGLRVSKQVPGSENAQYTAELEHSAQDLNGGSFVGADAILNVLFKLMGRNYMPTTIKDAYDEGILEPTIGYLGNLYNGYKFIDSNRALKWEGNWEEYVSNKKAGNKWEQSMYLQNMEGADLLPILNKPSYYGDDNYNPQTKIYDSSKDYNDSRSILALKSMLPFFSEGRDADYVDIDNLFGNGYQTNIHKRYVTLTNKDSTFGYDVVTHAQTEPLTYDEELAEIRNHTRDAKAFDLLVEKKKLFHDDLYNSDTEALLKALSFKVRATDNNTEEIKNLIKEFDNMEELYNNYTSITPDGNISNYLSTFKHVEPTDVLETSKLTASDNGIKLINSWLTSYGYKAANNGEIALGAKTLNFQNNVGHTIDELLGYEINFLLRMSKVSPELYQLFNKYMEMEAAIEMHYALKDVDPTTGVVKIKNTMTEEAFLEATELDNKIFSTMSVEDMNKLLGDMLIQTPALKTMVACASKINTRLIKEVSEIDPLGVVGWYLSTDAPIKTKRSWFMYKNKKLQGLYKSDFISSLKAIDYELDKMKDTEKACLFFNNDLGYVGMVQNIAQQCALNRASDNLGRYLKSNGWMENATPNRIAFEIFERKIKIYMGEEATRDEDAIAYNKYTYNNWVHQLNELGIQVNDYYKNAGSLYRLYQLASTYYHDLLTTLKVSSMQEARDAAYKLSISNDSAQKKVAQEYTQLLNVYENILSGTLHVITHDDKRADLYGDIVNGLKANIPNGKVLVNSFGQHINPADNTLDYSSHHFYWDVLNLLSKPEGEDEIKLYYAKEALLGNIYVMDSSVAKQLEKKVYSTRIHSRVKEVMRKAKNIATSFIMSSPVSLLDRLVNFPLYDSGIVIEADYRAAKYFPEAIATITKYVNAGNSLTDESIANDPNMKMFIRFLTATNQDVFDNSVRGEKVKLNIPLIRKYTELANLGYNIGNLIPRFAYFLDLIYNTQADGELDKQRLGVCYDKYDAIKEITAEDYIKHSTDLYSNEHDADIDAQAAYIIAQHNGLEGNMPYAAKWLNENFNTMFLSFPLQGVRWAANRMKSLAQGFTDGIEGNDGFKYLAGQLGSVVLSYALLLGLEMLLSYDTRDYLKKKIAGKDDEITEEERTHAQNLIFRGGVVKPFQSLMQGEEVTSTSQNRGAISQLFNSYIADFTKAYGDNDESLATKMKNFVMSHTWSHTNFLPKDIVESIPGNKVFQSTGWYTPGSNFLDNYGRKVLGYSLGSAQANSFMDYMQSRHSIDLDEERGLRKLGNAMEYAFTTKYTNSKESKSSNRNYKKAIQIVYDYYNAIYGDWKSTKAHTTTNEFDSFNTKLKKAIETSNATDVYNLIEEEINKGASFKDIQSALRKCLLREKILTLPNTDNFLSSLSDTEYNVVKTALLHEAHLYPWIDDMLDWINSETTKEYYKEHSYTKSLSSSLKTHDYNARGNYYSYNSNYSKLNNVNRFFQSATNHYNKTQNNPTSAYAQAQKNITYGQSKDIYGNIYSKYRKD